MDKVNFLKLTDLENELLDETSLESFFSEFKLTLGIAAELASLLLLRRREGTAGLQNSMTKKR